MFPKGERYQVLIENRFNQFMISKFTRLKTKTANLINKDMNCAHSIIEEPCSKLQGIFPRKESCLFWIRSLTPQPRLSGIYTSLRQATGNALAIAVHFLQKNCLVICIFISFFLFAVEIEESGAKSQTVRKPDKDYNVVMIFIDTLRADHLGSYGYPKKTSPHIDKLSQESIVFKNHFASNTVTISSFMSIITSLYPGSHGVFHVAKDKLSPRIKPLAEILKIFGYATTWLGWEGDPHTDPKIGFGRGFDKSGHFPSDLIKARKILFDTIEKNKNNKFYINFHTYKVHDPYMPSKKYKKNFTNEQREEVIETSEEWDKAAYDFIKKGLLQKSGKVSRITKEVLGKDDATKLLSKKLFDGEYNPKKFKNILRFMAKKKKAYKIANLQSEAYFHRFDSNDIGMMDYVKSLYDAEILEFDTEIIGPLIKKLKDLDLYDRSIIIICADHGDEFGEHGGMGHGKSLYDEVIYV
ncbi:MAG: sulfatase-like hydrolase/transferase, partial [Desulfobacterales bacterium]